ncbi:MAG: metallophosphoesterase [Desulfobacteraceae bacterium]|nr:MAG: metallophosphoesterase [Desulfobacteraceae bacterium]
MKKVLRLAAVGDLHCKLSSTGSFAPLFKRVHEHADALLLCGDLTDYGLVEEARVLTNELKEVVDQMPVIAVLGNHDYQSGKQLEIQDLLSDHGIILLDGNCYEICGVGFTGTKGFGGGFKKRGLQAWGEDAIKAFVEESRLEAMKLESSLARLDSTGRVVLLHYSPIRDTLIGESPEIFPFLGSSFLEEALNRHPVSVVFHGHSHGGSPEGYTSRQIPVYNVSLSLMRRLFSEEAPYRLFQIEIESTECFPDRIQEEVKDV